MRKLLSPPISEIRMKKPRLRRIGGDNRSRQPASWSVPSAAAGPALFGQPVGGCRPLRDDEGQHREAENCGADIGAAPADAALHRQQRRGRDGGAEDSAKCVEREDLADPRRRAVMGQERIIRRVISSVAEAGDGIHGDEHGERIDEAHDCIGCRAKRDAGDRARGGRRRGRPGTRLASEMPPTRR